MVHLGVLIVALAVGQTAYEDSVALYGMGRLDESLAMLERAEKETGDPQLLAKIHRQKAFIFERLGDERAIEAFIEALRFDPKISVDARQHGVKVVALFECARKRSQGASCEEPPKPPAQARPLVSATVEPSGGASLRSWAWAPAAGSVVLGGLSAIFLVRADSKYDALAASTPPSPFVAPEELRDDGARSQRIGWVLAAGAGTALISAALMFALGDSP